MKDVQNVSRLKLYLSTMNEIRLSVLMLMVRFLFRIFGECRLLLHCYYCQVHSDTELQYLLMSHIDLFKKIIFIKNYFYYIGLCVKKILRNNYTKNININEQ